MKKASTFIMLILCLGHIIAQVPQAINYQAVYEDASTGIYKKSTVVVKISIIQGTPKGSEVFTETLPLN